jgi:hypothetical protein
VSPVIFREKGFRFFFFSREESRKHIHVRSADGEAKFWLEPEIELAEAYRFNGSQLKTIEIQSGSVTMSLSAWKKYFGS